MSPIKRIVPIMIPTVDSVDNSLLVGAIESRLKDLF
jgi:hypothetical protein